MNYWVWPHPSEKDPVFPQSVYPIRKLPQAPYSSPSEGRQTENQNHRELTNLISWTTALSNSMKLWALPCKATQDGWVMLESSDKMWSTWEREWKTTAVFLPDQLSRSVGTQYATGDQGGNKSRKNGDGAKVKTTPSCGCDWWWKQGLLL